MFKKLLLLVALVATTISYGQSPTGAWSVTPPTTEGQGAVLSLEGTFNAGGAGITVDGNVYVDLALTTDNGLTFTQVSGAATSQDKDGQESGTITASITVPNELTPTADLSAGEFYALRLYMQNSNTLWGGVDETEITITETITPYINITVPDQTLVDLNGAYSITYYVNHSGTIYAELKNQNDVAVAGKNISTPVVGVETTVNYTGLSVWGEVNVGDVMTWGAAQFGPKISATNMSFNVVGVLSDQVEELDEINVYPNPTSGVIHISDVSNVDSITVSNVNGQVVKSFAAQNTIDISDLTAGIYILKTDNGLIRKIIKQ